MEHLESFIKVLFFSYARYFVVAGLFYFILYKVISTSVSHLKIQTNLASKADFMREISNSLIVASIFASVAFLIVYTDVKNFTKIYSDVNQYPVWWMPISIVIALIIHDTYFYWMHRLLHSPKIYKIVHLEHHKSVNPSPWAAYSFHFTEGFLEILIVPILLFLLPMHFSMAFLFSVIVLFINVYGHLGYELMPKFMRKTWLFEVLGTSVYHNLHHEKFNYNFGLYFRVWDRIMGTEFPKYTEVFDQIKSRKSQKTKVALSNVE